MRALGAIGVSVGYAVWGWRLVRCLGGRITFLSPSRAFSAQICTLATVVAVSKIGIPVSTTHIFIGALLGVSIADNLKACALFDDSGSCLYSHYQKWKSY